ncbi:MAG: hypothetical protein JXA89_19745, partial [Anaerolineae bacterium]|nr:hypothetical protein [Anaerolineae bacterium]
MNENRSRLVGACLLVLAVLSSACVAKTEEAEPDVPLVLPPPGGQEPAQPANGTIYYVRSDGGTADQCTGLVDAPYPGSGAGQPCAWDHPFRALPPLGEPKIGGGDTVIIASGSYMMGYGAPGSDACDADGAFDCHMPAVPGGPNPGNPTRILGAGWDSGCSAP